MRDIREDLRQRLVALRGERSVIEADFKKAVANLSEQEEACARLLDLEERRLGHLSTENVATRPKEEKTSAELDAEFESDILEILGDGRPRPHGEIKAAMEAKGWEPSDEKTSLGRQIQGTLLSLSRNRGLIQFMGDSVWRKASKEAASAA